MANFIIAHGLTMKVEAGYANSKFDTGGETYRGISRKNFPSWDGWEIIDACKISADFPNNLHGFDGLEKKVTAFYVLNFWNKIMGDAIASQKIANEVYDTAVNFGHVQAGLMLQDALNLLNKNGSEFPDLLVDGKIGSKTIEVLNGIKNIDPLLRTLNGLQFMKYVKICEHNPEQEYNFVGWLKRT